MMNKALVYSCAQSMREVFNGLMAEFSVATPSTFTSDRQRQLNTDMFVQKFHNQIFSDSFAEMNKENFLAFASANSLIIKNLAIDKLFEERHLMHNSMANGFLACISAVISELSNITKNTSLSLDMRSQLFKRIANSIVEDSANVISIKLLSEEKKRAYAYELLTDPGYLHLMNMAMTYELSSPGKLAAFDKVFSYYDGKMPESLFKTGMTNSAQQPFMAYMRNPGNSFNGSLFTNGLSEKDITNSLVYQTVLNSESVDTWINFANKGDLTQYTVNFERPTNAFAHYLKTCSDRSDFADFGKVLQSLDSKTFKKMGDPDFLSKLPVQDAKFIFGAFLERYVAHKYPIIDLAAYLNPATINDCPFIVQSLLDNYNTRSAVIDHCLKHQISPVTLASQFGLDVNSMVESVYGYNSEADANRIIDKLDASVNSYPSGSIERTKALFQAVEFRMYLYKGGSAQSAVQERIIEDIEPLSRAFRESLEATLASSSAGLSLEEITQQSKWVGEFQIDRLRTIAIRLINQHTLEHGLAPEQEPEQDDNSPPMRPY